MNEALMGDALSQKWLDMALKEFQTEYPVKESDDEMILLLDAKGEFNGLKAPRWLCHLLGLRHGTVHIILWSATNEPRMLFQVRSKMKKDFPSHLELSVTGHGGVERDWIASAYREMQEEIGISKNDLCGNLIFVGSNLLIYNEEERFFHDREYTRIYTQRLKPSGITSLAPNHDEVEKVLFFRENDINDIYGKYKIAPGFYRQS